MAREGKVTRKGKRYTITGASPSSAIYNIGTESMKRKLAGRAQDSGPIDRPGFSYQHDWEPDEVPVLDRAGNVVSGRKPRSGSWSRTTSTRARVRRSLNE